MASALRTHRVIGFTVAAAIFIVDQLVKWAVTYPLDLPNRYVVELLPIFDLKWVENRGISTGLLTASTEVGRWLLVALTAAISVAVTWFLWRERNRGDALAFGLVLGGALGNILDRVRLGYVVDFAHLHFGEFSPFLVFNVADAAITIGVLLLVLRAFFAREKVDPAENVNA